MTSAARQSTIARANWGRYVASESTATATANNPINTRVLNAFRTWSDAQRQLLPRLQSHQLRGQRRVRRAERAARPDERDHHIGIPSGLSGWGVRPSDVELLLGVQQKLTERAVLDVQWSRHSFNNLFATQYLATPASAYDTYCITAPDDPRLPGGGGNQICGFTDLQARIFRDHAERFGAVGEQARERCRPLYGRRREHEHATQRGRQRIGRRQHGTRAHRFLRHCDPGHGRIEHELVGRKGSARRRRREHREHQRLSEHELLQHHPAVSA